MRLAIDPGPDGADPGVRLCTRPGPKGLTLFLVLRAFASGCAALTGVEAISNGIPAFKKPESKNAVDDADVDGGDPRDVSSSASRSWRTSSACSTRTRSRCRRRSRRRCFGDNARLLRDPGVHGADPDPRREHGYADFPRLGSILAKDRFLPHQFTFRGDRLAFSNGIIVLGGASIALLVVFDADVDRLIPLYAFGVFVSFTLSQSGMVVHWLRLKERGWRQSLVINGVGAAATGVVALIVGGTKFSEGAWISMIAMFVLAMPSSAIYRHYTGVERKLCGAEGRDRRDGDAAASRWCWCRSTS